MNKNKTNVVGTTQKTPYQKPEIQVIELTNSPVLLQGSNTGTGRKPVLPTIPIEDWNNNNE